MNITDIKLLPQEAGTVVVIPPSSGSLAEQLIGREILVTIETVAATHPAPVSTTQTFMPTIKLTRGRPRTAKKSQAKGCTISLFPDEFIKLTKIDPSPTRAVRQLLKNQK